MKPRILKGGATTQKLTTQDGARDDRGAGSLLRTAGPCPSHIAPLLGYVYVRTNAIRMFLPGKSFPENGAITNALRQDGEFDFFGNFDDDKKSN